MRQCRPETPKKIPSERLELWLRLLREDWERGIAQPEMPIEALYDDVTGLPA